QALEVPDVSDWLGNLVLSQKAYDALQAHINDAVEFLPIDCQGESWYIVNVIQIESAVDEAKSERNIMNGELMGISKLVMDESKLSGQPIFRIDYDERTNNYATDALKKLMGQAKLNGVEFREDLACF
ncbi:MAG: hypothetical protein MI867_30380, partial [Pseudomonadales bacterium]|nr:hypothetical protein [Pseudomonadales bacterium]